MKKIILLFLLCFLRTGVFAQVAGNDSMAYQQQRTKINRMLAERKEKFGQYQESLTQHSGIFGMQTKKDIRRSQDILMDIAATDNEIFRQLKILFDYRNFQQTKIQSQAKEAESTNLAYRDTINKLKQKIEQLKAIHPSQQKTQYFYVILFVLMLASILFLLLKKRNVKV